MPSRQAQENVQLDLFIEQAEYIETEQFKEWTIEHPDEELIIQKLSQSGAKLITGPRGCGKTTLLLKTYHALCTNRSERTLAVYVNFKASLKLEPFYKTSGNAPFLFQQWLVYKVYDGLYDVLELLKAKPPALRHTRAMVKHLLRQLELGKAAPFEDETNTVLPSGLEDDLARVVSSLKLKRCVLLLDDAAHAFSNDQQRDFFEFFRQVKSKLVSPKAAIYPGVTIYSPTFHVGHDAEEVDVWLRPESPRYLGFMRDLLERRLPAAVWKQLEQNGPLLDLVCYAAFGVPRSLLNIVRSFYSGGSQAEGPVNVDFTRASALRAIKASYESAMSVFGSLRMKLPMYERFIDVGRNVFNESVGSIKDYNRGKPNTEQSVTVAVRKPIASELQKVFGFFQYAGLMLPRGEVSRGEKGSFELYVVHYAALVDTNALIARKSVNISSYVEAFQTRHAKDFARVTAKTLLGTDDAASVLSLSLPPCQECDTPRISDAAKFCLNCGTKLQSVSVFESLVKNDIATLPLTEGRVASIKANSTIRTVKDILLDHEHRQLRSVRQIGPYWAKRIYSYAEEHIA
jgi:ABC-type iron transport system FetAB ATPase subunit